MRHARPVSAAASVIVAAMLLTSALPALAIGDPGDTQDGQPVPRAPIPKAFTKTFSNGTLTINGSGAPETIDVDCAAPFVELNSMTLPGQQVRCSRVKNLKINGEGGADDIEFRPTISDFPKLASPTLTGGAGNDVLTGWDARETLNGGGSADHLYPYDGSGTLIGGRGFDTANVFGTTVTIAPGSATHDGKQLSFSSINDVFVAGTGGADVLDLSAWNRNGAVVNSFSGNDQITGSPKADSITPGSGNVTINAGAGNDTLRASGGTSTLNGQGGTDILLDLPGGSGTTVTLSDSMYTSTYLTNADTLMSIEDASLTGNTGSGVIFNATGWAKGVRIRGSAGNDTITGGPGDDELDGYAGTDVVTGGNGTDTVYVLVYSTTTFVLTNTTLSGYTNTDTISGFEAARFEVVQSDPLTVNASAFTGPVTMIGAMGSDVLIGGTNGDFLFGNEGPDTLDGNGGNDTLDGGPGTDTCDGGTGTNTITNCSP